MASTRVLLQSLLLMWRAISPWARMGKGRWRTRYQSGAHQIGFRRMIVGAASHLVSWQRCRLLQTIWRRVGKPSNRISATMPEWRRAVPGHPLGLTVAAAHAEYRGRRYTQSRRELAIESYVVVFVDYSRHAGCPTAAVRAR